MLLEGEAFAQKRELTKHYVMGRMRIFYNDEGVGAVDATDSDSSGVPDQVEDIAKQLWATHQLFCEVLDFPDPFESERYKGVVCIEASVRDSAEIGGGNGVAFENQQKCRAIPESQPGEQALVMAIATKVNAIKNVTPSHEFFHLIQYGATYFKTKWYLEGQARWSEHALGLEGVGEGKYSARGPWPQKPQELQQLADMSYDAEFVLWNPIAARTDSDGLLTPEKLGKELTDLKYSDGSPVVKDHLLTGPEVMRDILIELSKQDDIAFKELGYRSWTEENQRAPENNPYIYKAIMDVLRKRAPPVGRYVIPRRSR
ncbi:MAG: hypothetical protein R3C49_02320 [Planctomycetaceae bacterium]